MGDNAPMGANEDSRCPWFRKEPEEVVVKVMISQTLSISTEVTVKEDYDLADLVKAVRDKVILPSDHCKDWIEDDFEVIEE